MIIITIIITIITVMIITIIIVMITMIIIHVMITPRQRLRLRSHDNRLNYEQIHAVHSRRRTLRNNNTNNNTDNNTYIIMI